jgi:hypothetical protein
MSSAMRRPLRTVRRALPSASMTQTNWPSRSWRRARKGTSSRGTAAVASSARTNWPARAPSGICARSGPRPWPGGWSRTGWGGCAGWCLGKRWPPRASMRIAPGRRWRCVAAPARRHRPRRSATPGRPGQQVGVLGDEVAGFHQALGDDAGERGADARVGEPSLQERSSASATASAVRAWARSSSDAARRSTRSSKRSGRAAPGRGWRAPCPTRRAAGRLRAHQDLACATRIALEHVQLGDAAFLLAVEPHQPAQLERAGALVRAETGARARRPWW